jgi:putative membrane protein
MIVPQGRLAVTGLLTYVGKPLLALVGYDLLVVAGYKVEHWNWVALPHIPLALFGSAIGVILAFRNQSSYGRWWEARTLWGSLVNNSRSWARQATTLMMPLNDAEAGELKEMQRRMVYHQIAYVHALRQHLRGLEPWKELLPLLSEQELNEVRNQKNVPLALQEQMSVLLRECQSRGWVDRAHWLVMDKTLDDLTDAQGGTERIKNTPMPRQYYYFPQLFVHIYCVLLPLALVINMGWYTPLGSTLVGFIFLALDKIGRDLEDPFHNTVYDIPLTSITTTIEVNLRQLLGETAVPKAEVPVDGVLW